MLTIMTQTFNNNAQQAWSQKQKGLFRFIFLFFILQALPLSIDLFKALFGPNWLSYGYIFNLTRLSPKFIPGADSFINWIIVLVLALIGSFVWAGSRYKEQDYDKLYYWLRTVVRYRLAIGIIGYGFLKFFPLQAPFPSISNLNTAYGDFNDWKIFSLSLGIVPGYEAFLGGVEILAGLLLLFRKTATFGALLILVFTGNVFISNLAYEGGEYVYSFYLISFATLVFWFDAQRVFNLISLDRPTQPNAYQPIFVGTQQTLRIGLKAVVIFFFIFLYGFKTYSGYRHDPYQFPKTAGLKHAAGIYNVSEFRINNKVRPYSATDPVRWRDVVFEKWATLSIRSNRPVLIDSANYEQISQKDEDRDYELVGSAGRHYYSYKVDTMSQTLLLTNKNPHYRNEHFSLNYIRPDSTTIILNGLDQNRDSIYVVLNKIDKKYPINLGRRKVLKL